MFIVVVVDNVGVFDLLCDIGLLLLLEVYGVGDIGFVVGFSSVIICVEMLMMSMLYVVNMVICGFLVS